MALVPCQQAESGGESQAGSPHHHCATDRTGSGGPSLASHSSVSVSIHFSGHSGLQNRVQGVQAQTLLPILPAGFFLCSLFPKCLPHIGGRTRESGAFITASYPEHSWAEPPAQGMHPVHPAPRLQLSGGISCSPYCGGLFGACIPLRMDSPGLAAGLHKCTTQPEAPSSGCLPRCCHFWPPVPGSFLLPTLQESCS